MVRSLVVRAGLMLWVATAGCSNDSAPAPIPFSELGSDVVDLICNGAVLCGTFPDRATCLASNAVDLGQLSADITAGKTKYDGAAASRCFAAVRKTQAATCTISGRTQAPTDESCEKIFTGTLADGASCLSGNECLSGLCDLTACTGPGSCCAGTCAPTATNVPIGGDCTRGQCVDGTYCRFASGTTVPTAVCSEFIRAGQPCDPSTGDVCALGLTCLPSSPPVPGGVCGAPPKEGESCFGFVTCDDTADYCDGTRCVHDIAVGAPCPNLGCVAYAICDPVTSTCVARPKAGEPCVSDGSDLTKICLGSLTCSNGTCVLPPASPACQ